MISWLRNRRRRKLLELPFPEGWERHLRRNVHHYQELSREDQAKLRDDLRIFIDDKFWETVDGLELTDEMKVTIAAQACLLTLRMDDHDYFRGVRTVILYPNPFLNRHRGHGPGGIVSEGGINSGQAWFRGPVILSWAQALAGGRDMTDGRNVVLHEFAHALDMADGLVNGTPPLSGGEQSARWFEVMTDEYQRLIEASRRGEPTLLDKYGATNVGEFFAVATECFFERGLWMRHLHPRLYEVLREYYQQDPAARGVGQRV
ncbi:MAG: zinc-dependent peptidase [Phycisphaerales bacterium]|nr:zinc-dependent peptidase [Phycisphaerales bacterium]MCI0631000.1 zinc-dependent peptidase [Phycisphaerales bacterium]MCI0676487.1 zinc-dependent peptidase [Phycisphaerales bacterium]